MPGTRHHSLVEPGPSRGRAHLRAPADQQVAQLAARVAELEAANAELARSNDELAEFASIASHELRAPLQTIGGYAELLQGHSAPVLDDEAAEYLGDIRRGVDRLRVLVDALLAYARVGTGVRRRDDVDCEQVMAGCADSLRGRIDEVGGSVTWGSLPTVVGDPDELAVVFANLVGNALKFSRPGAVPEVVVSARRAGQAWQFLVADNGTGIAPDERERVFRVFQSLPGRPGASGSGIGLAVCRRIVEGHGGRIWVGEGTRGGADLCFTIPAPVCWSPFG